MLKVNLILKKVSNTEMKTEVKLILKMKVNLIPPNESDVDTININWNRCSLWKGNQMLSIESKLDIIQLINMN